MGSINLANNLSRNSSNYQLASASAFERIKRTSLRVDGIRLSLLAGCAFAAAENALSDKH
jgi:hypothetical protein